MKQPEKKEILRPNPGRIIGIFSITFVVFELIFVLSFLSSIEESFFWFTPFLLAATIIFCIISIKETSYQILPTKIVHTKMGKVSEYNWNDIIYIDEDFSEQHKMLLFYTKEGKEHFLVFDKEWKIYEAALNKVHQISKEELKRRFPNAKL